METGRPLKYKTVEALQAAIDDYFDKNKSKLSITGLALHLGFNSRISFYNYEGRDAFLNTIKKARSRIEKYYEENLLTPGVQSGVIFALKNFGWTDRQEIEHSVDGKFSVNPKEWVNTKSE
jgi:hypothetical protein